MKKLSKDQRYYRERKKEEKKDFLLVDPESSQKSVKVSRISLCVRVSLEAAERLVELSHQESLYQWEMLDRVILKGIGKIAEVDTGKYKSRSERSSPLVRYVWNDQLLNAAANGKKYKGDKGSKQINLRISSTAYKTLQCCSNDIKQSKARIIQSLICNYKPMSLQLRQKQKDYRQKVKDHMYEWDRLHMTSKLDP